MIQTSRFSRLNTHHARFFRNWLLKSLPKDARSSKAAFLATLHRKYAMQRPPNPKFLFELAILPYRHKAQKSPKNSASPLRIKFRARKIFSRARVENLRDRCGVGVASPRTLRGGTDKAPRVSILHQNGAKLHILAILAKTAKLKFRKFYSKFSSLAKMAILVQLRAEIDSHRGPEGALREV